MTSETNGTSIPNPSDSSDEPDVSPGGSAPPTAPMPAQAEAAGDGEQATRGQPLLPASASASAEPDVPAAAAPAPPESESAPEEPEPGAPEPHAAVLDVPEPYAAPVEPEVAAPAPAMSDATRPEPARIDPPAPAPAPAAHRHHSHRRTAEPVYHTSAVYGGKPEPQPAKRRTLAVTLTAGVLAVLVVALVLALTVFQSNNVPPAHGIIPTGKSAQANGEQVASAFLTAWKQGDYAKAANLTDQPTAASAGLASYAKDLNLKKFAASPSSVTDATGSTAVQPKESVKFAISASVGAGTGSKAVRGTWAYHSTLVAYQQANSSVWFVAWQPDVLAPNLTAAQHLAAVSVAPTVSMVTDASGQNLARYGDAGLTTIGGLLKAQAPATEGANPGLDVEIQTKSGTPVANSQAPIVSPGNYPTLSTTIDAKAEAAARSSVATHKGSSIVAIQPSTGKILAIANNAQQNDFALTAAVAPGSTMKIITSTALLNSGLATANTGVECPAALTVQGITYHNDAGESEPAGTPLAYDFAQSCNNAFSQWWPHLSGKLASTAKDYFGLNQKWNIGIGNVSASYFNAPASASGSELAQEAFGEGQLVASPLAMASVVATVASGSFKQPILTTNAKQVTAKPLPAATDAGLKQMMREVVTQGTGAGLGFGANVYAKTGTADIVGQEQPNSWLVAFDPTKDVAVACLVVNAGYGAQFAGPEVSSFLNSF